MKKLPLLILLILFLGNLQAQITAEFSASTTTGCGETEVAFLDLSTSNNNIQTWLWDFGDGNTSNQQNPIITYFVPDNYTVCLTVTDDMGGNNMICKTDFIEINPVPVCIINFNIPVLNCANIFVTLDGSQSSTGPNFTYLWSTTNGNIVSGSSTTNAIVDSPGLYTLEVTHTSNGCSSNTTVEVISDTSIPVADVSATQMTYIIDCTTTSISPYYLDGSNSSAGPNIVYAWYDSNNNLISNDIIFGVNNLGTYTFTVTDTVSLCTNTDFVTIVIVQNITPPIADAEPDMILSCAEITVTLIGNGSSVGTNITYAWFDSNGSVISTTLNPTISTPGTYTLVVTDNDNGCWASSQVIVSADTNLPSTSLNATTLVCPGEMVIIDLAVPCLNCSIEVLDGMGNIVCTNLPCEIDPTDEPFQITVTDLNNGCQNVDNFSISVLNPFVIAQVITTDVSCFGENDGAIDIDISEGSAPYFFTWSNGSIIEDQSGLSPGTYTVSIIDANGCELVESFEILEPAPIQITNVVVTNVSCAGINDGNIEITVEGGTSFYNYQWLNGGIPSNGLSTGTYNVTITDANGCTFVSPNYEITQNVCFDFLNDTTICVGGIVPLSDETPMSDFNYAWSPAIGLNDPNIPNPIASPSETTTYILTITDGNGTVIFNAQGPTVTVQNYLDFGLLDFSNAPLCDGDTLELYGNLGTSFLWTGPNGYVETLMNPTINNVTEFESGIYSLTITDNFNCTASADVDVDVFIDDDCVWPGDTDTNMVVNHFDLLNIGLAYDSVGTIRENPSFDWFSQPSFDWSQTTPTSNVNYKHIDADGNGIIEAADTMAITQNFGFTHNFVDPVDNQFTNLPPTDGFTMVTPFYIEPDTLIEGQTISLNLILGDVSNIVIGLYGIGFSIEYDSSVVVPGSASINFDNCWLGDVNADAISIQFDFPNPGRIDAAITRIDGMEMDGYGLFGDLIITLEDDILLWNGGSGSNNFEPTTDVTADFAITNYHLINFSQEEILVEGMTTTAPIGETTNLSFIELNELITVFPNPAKDAFFIASQKIDLEVVRIFSATGELKVVKTDPKNTLEFSTENLASGVYFIEIQTREGIVTKKLFIQ
jgi:PKD repeat protein